MSPRTLAAVAFVAMGVVAACGGDADETAVGGSSEATTTTTAAVVAPEPFDAAFEGTLVRWSETAGECQVCGFSITFDASGTAVYEGYRTRSTVEFDVDRLRERLDRIDRASLTEGTDDCGREVDGNAPVLEVHRADGPVLEIDDCYTPIDRDHPLMTFVLETMSQAHATEARLLVEVADAGGRCVDGACRSTTRIYDDGALVREGDDGAITTSSLTDADRETLGRLVDAASEEDLVLGPFTESCPTEVDGQERTYAIGGDEDEPPIVVASCRDALDPRSPLLLLADRLVADAVSG